MSPYAVAGGALTGVLLLGLALWFWKREAVKRALNERESQQREAEYERNLEANERQEAREKARPKLVGDTVDPNNPWSGVR